MAAPRIEMQQPFFARCHKASLAARKLPQKRNICRDRPRFSPGKRRLRGRSGGNERGSLQTGSYVTGTALATPSVILGLDPRTHVFQSLTVVACGWSGQARPWRRRNLCQLLDKQASPATP